jgi:CHASE3 domain sensor protein
MKKTPVATGLERHVKTSHGLLIIGAIVALLMMGLFYYVSQQNTDNRSKAAYESNKTMCSNVCKETLDLKTNMKKKTCSIQCPKIKNTIPKAVSR